MKLGCNILRSSQGSEYEVTVSWEVIPYSWKIIY